MRHFIIIGLMLLLPCVVVAGQYDYLKTGEVDFGEIMRRNFAIADRNIERMKQEQYQQQQLRNQIRIEKKLDSIQFDIDQLEMKKRMDTPGRYHRGGYDYDGY